METLVRDLKIHNKFVRSAKAVVDNKHDSFMTQYSNWLRASGRWKPTVVQTMAKTAQDATHKMQLHKIRTGDCMRTTICELTPRMKQCRAWKKRSVSSFAPGSAEAEWVASQMKSHDNCIRKARCVLDNKLDDKHAKFKQFRENSNYPLAPIMAPMPNESMSPAQKRRHMKKMQKATKSKEFRNVQIARALPDHLSVELPDIDHGCMRKIVEHTLCTSNPAVATLLTKHTEAKLPHLYKHVGLPPVTPEKPAPPMPQMPGSPAPAAPIVEMPQAAINTQLSDARPVPSIRKPLGARRPKWTQACQAAMAAGHFVARAEDLIREADEVSEGEMDADQDMLEGENEPLSLQVKTQVAGSMGSRDIDDEPEQRVVAKLPTMLPLRPGQGYTGSPAEAVIATSNIVHSKEDLARDEESSQGQVEVLSETPSGEVGFAAGGEEQATKSESGEGSKATPGAWFGTCQRKTNAETMKDGSWFKSFKQNHEMLFK